MDTQMRTLERRAALGDRNACKRLEAYAERCGRMRWTIERHRNHGRLKVKIVQAIDGEYDSRADARRAVDTEWDDAIYNVFRQLSRYDRERCIPRRTPEGLWKLTGAPLTPPGQWESREACLQARTRAMVRNGGGRWGWAE